MFCDPLSPFPGESYTLSLFLLTLVWKVLSLGNKDCGHQAGGVGEIPSDKVEGAHGLNTWILISIIIFITSCVILVKSLNLYEPQFLLL